MSKLRKAQTIAEKALLRISDYPTCLHATLIAMDALDALGIRHRASPNLSPLHQGGNSNE